MASKLILLSWATSYNLFFTSFPIGYLAVFDKDVTYEHLMTAKEEKEFYSENHFTGLSHDNSHIPTKTLKILPLIKQNFQYLYYITQKGLPFGWHTFLWQVFLSLIMSIILCLVGYAVYSGEHVFHIDGYTADFWMASFGIYTALVYATLVVVIVRSSQLTWVYVLVYIGGLSLAPFYFLSYTFDTILITTPNLKEYVMMNLSETYHFYLFFVFYMMVAFYIEICAVYFKLMFKPTLADYFKWLIKNGKAEDPDYFSPILLENFIKNHDPIPKKKLLNWADILSRQNSQTEDGSQEIQPSEGQELNAPEENNTQKPKETVDPEDGKLSLFSGNYFTNASTGEIYSNQRQSKTSLESNLPSLRGDTNQVFENNSAADFNLVNRVYSLEPPLGQIDQEIK